MADVSEPVQVQKIKIQPMTPETIEPFGEIISNPSQAGRSPDFTGVGTDAWYLDFHARGEPLLVSVHTHFAPLRFNRLERHLAVTQTFIPTGGAPSVVALAPAPRDVDDWDAVADVSEMTALLINNTSYMLRPGTWHSLDRFPLTPPGSDFIILTDRATQTEFTARPKAEWELTRDIDYEEEHGIVFELVL